MKWTLLAIPLIAGAIAVAGCGSSSAPAGDATNPATTEAGAKANRQAAATSDVGPGALKIVNRVHRTVTLRVTEVDNYDWANGNRPDHAPPQGFQGAQIVQNQFALANRLDGNTKANGHPFRIEVYGPSPTKPIASIRLALCKVSWTTTGTYDEGGSWTYMVQPETAAGTTERCRRGTVTDYPMGTYQDWAYGVRFTVAKLADIDPRPDYYDYWPDGPSTMEITQTVPPAQ